MKICQQTTEQIEKEVETWVEESTTKVEQVCSQVAKQVEQWQTTWENQCSQVSKQICGWLPWPLNMVCNWVTETVCTLVSVTIKVVSILITTVCQLVTTVIKALKKIIAKILVPFIKLVCVFVPAAAAQIVDEVPDLLGVNFDRRDANGNVIEFIWGVSTASFQVEGGLENNDWHHFTHTQSVKDRVAKLGNLGGTTLRIEPAGRAVDHWDPDVLAEDLDRARFLGLNAYRFSLEWSRIQPDPPPWARTVIESRAAARGSLIEADAERRAAEHGDSASHLARARELEAKAARLEEEARTAIETPYDETELQQDAVERYVGMVDAMLARELQPILTMNHMSLPEWVAKPPRDFDVAGLGAVEDDRYWDSLRGWETEATVAAFRKFVRFVTPFFADKVKYFVTMNEPIGSVTGAGYLAGVWPPGFLGSGYKGRVVYHNLIEAHIAAYDEIKAVVPDDAKVGISYWLGFARRAPQTIASKIFIGDNEAAKNQWDYAVNRYFFDAIILGHRNPEIWRKDEPDVIEGWEPKADFIAPQYYRACDIYHDIGIALTTPFWGGQFTGDLRGSTNYLAKYLWNDLGWTIYPGGLYRLLNDVYDRYNRPILITENGICERQDRNRAAYTISHLQQVLRAIKDGVDVIGYVHWSIVDNFEWAFGYQDTAHFGLFTIDRGLDPVSNNLKSFPRHITEGALAYQYLIANSTRITETNSNENPFDAVVARFGTISADGLSVQPPDQPSGVLWDASFPGGDGQPFMLYLSRLPGDRWLGDIFLKDERLWVRLQEVSWHQARGEEDEGQLTFRHPEKDDARGQVDYTALTIAKGSQRTDTRLQGKVTKPGAAASLAWVAERVMRQGIWVNKSSGYDPTHIALSRFEGEYDEWKGKAIYGKRIWGPIEDPITWNGFEFSTWFTGVGGFDGEVSGDMLTGTVKLIGGGGGATTPWAGERLADDIPFN